MRMARVYGSQRIDRVREPAALDLQPARREAVDTLDGQATHSQAMPRTWVLRGRLQRRDARGHHQHALEPERIAGVAGDGEMAEMRWVERPSEDADRSKLGRRLPLLIDGDLVGIDAILKRGRARPLRLGT